MANERNSFGKWQQWRPQDVAKLFAPLNVPWWIAGGWALDLFLGMQTREHDDIEVQFLRRDQQAVRALLHGWDIQGVYPRESSGVWPFREWEPGTLLGSEVFNAWSRPDKNDLWTLELMIGEARDDQWLFRRDARIFRPLSTIGRLTDDGIPYLAPEIQLLYKAKSLRPKDKADFARVLPHLDREGRQWLFQSLAVVHPHHPWLLQLKGY